MHSSNYSFFVFALTTMMLSACAIKHDPTVFIPDKDPVIKISRVCKSRYDASNVGVAIAPFKNNTTFGAADISQDASENENTTKSSERNGRSKTRTKEKSVSTQTIRKINSKLASSVEELLINEVYKINGIRIYTRRDMPKILNEQKFQNSGLVDEKQAAKIGKMAGVKYIITGSITNAMLNHRKCSEAKQRRERQSTGNANADNAMLILDLIGGAAQLACKAVEGWSVDTAIAIRMIDVETAEVVYSEVVEGKERFGQVNNPNPSYDTIIAAIKKSAAKAVQDIKPRLSRLYTTKGRIVQTRTSPDGKERSALIDLGTKKGIEPASKLSIYTFQEITDPTYNKASCSAIKLQAYLEVTDQVQSNQSWAIIKGKPEDLQKVKVGQIVETNTAGIGQGLMDKMGL